MKTSMNILRATNACTGGFGRQASFWTVRPKAKAIEYPIWMIGLTGSYDDLGWAINNALVIDEAEFKELKDRTFWPMFQQIFWSNITADYILKQSTKKAGDFVRDSLQDALKIKNREEAEAWMAKYRRFKLSTPLFSNVANHNCWSDPQQYLSHLTHALFEEKTEACLEHERLPFDLEHHLPGHDSRNMKAKAVKRIPATRRYRDDDDEDSPRKDAAPKSDKPTYFDIPKSAKGRVITKGETFAHVVLNEDPWPVALQFLLDHNVPKVIGSKVNLSKVSPDGVKPPQFAASLHLNDPRTIFTLMHLLQGQDFDLLKAIGVEAQAQTLRRALVNYGPNDDTLDSVDMIVDNESGDCDEAQRRLVNDMTVVREHMAEAGPTNGAIRERVIRTASAQSDTADDSWEPTAAVAADGDEEEDDEA